MIGITDMKGCADVWVYIICGCIGIKGLRTYVMCGYTSEVYWYIKPYQTGSGATALSGTNQYGHPLSYFWRSGILTLSLCTYYRGYR
jgi:hypothetical protein